MTGRISVKVRPYLCFPPVAKQAALTFYKLQAVLPACAPAA